MTNIVVPTLGESVSSATVARWLKKAGDAVAADEPLVELETDKVTVEVNAQVAPASNGTLSYQWYKGTEALSGQTAATLTLTGLELAKAAPFASTKYPW